MFQNEVTNYHVRFLGGKEAVRPLTYPVLQWQSASRDWGSARRNRKEDNQ
jgi:hypothetical protein